MKSQIPVYLLIVGVGIIIGLLLKPSDVDIATQANSTPSTVVPTQNTNEGVDTKQDIGTTKQIDELQARLSDLDARLTQEIEQRESLQLELAQLKKTLTEPAKSEDENDNQSLHLSTRPIRGGNQSGQWFNHQALLDAGVDEAQATRIRDMYEDIEMQKLYLRDKAIREGWIGGDKYREERTKLNDKLDVMRDELEPGAYDAYLYASGQPNRVIVTSALNNSPAAKAGIQSGDTIFSYNNKRIYTWSDLRTATTSGELNAVVLVEVLRDGQPVSVYVPTGPLGVQLDHKSVAPVN